MTLRWKGKIIAAFTGQPVDTANIKIFECNTETSVPEDLPSPIDNKGLIAVIKDEFITNLLLSDGEKWLFMPGAAVSVPETRKELILETGSIYGIQLAEGELLFLRSTSMIKHGNVSDGAKWVQFHKEGNIYSLIDTIEIKDLPADVWRDANVSADDGITIVKDNNTYKIIANSTLARQAALEEEITRAQAEESGLENLIWTEHDRAISSESELRDLITAEIHRAEDVESGLAEEIQAEVARATGIETALAGDLADEITRAEVAESALGSRLDSEILRAQEAESGLEELISQESTRAIEAEQDIREEFDQKISDIETEMDEFESGIEDYVNQKLSRVYDFKGSVHEYSDLPKSGMKVGDVWNIELADPDHNIKAGDNVAWTGEIWDPLAGITDLSAYATKAEVIGQVNRIESEIDDLESGLSSDIAGINSELDEISDTLAELDETKQVNLIPGPNISLDENGNIDAIIPSLPSNLWTRANLKPGEDITFDESGESGEVYINAHVPDVIDSLDSESSENALSAKQGKVLGERTEDLRSDLTRVEEQVESIEVQNREVEAGNDIVITTRTTSAYDDAVACWHFDEDCIDSVGEVDLSSQGSIDSSESKFEGGKAFAPSMTNSPVSVNFGFTSSSDITIDFWAKANNETSALLNLGFTGLQFDNPSLQFSLVNAGETSIQIKTSSEPITIPKELSDKYIDPGLFNHFALTYKGSEGGKLNVFINGMKIFNKGSEPVISVLSGFSHFSIQKTSETAQVFIDELRICNKIKYVSSFAVPKNPYYKYFDTIAVNSELSNQVAENTEAIEHIDDNYEPKLTGAKLYAVNSGITEEKVRQIETNRVNISNLDASLNNRITSVSNTLQGNIDKKSNILAKGKNVTLTDITEGGLDKVRIDVETVIPDDVWRKNTLTQGNAIIIGKVDKPDIDDNTAVLLHFDNDSFNYGREELATVFPNNNITVNYSDSIAKWGYGANLTTSNSSYNSAVLTTLNTSLGKKDFTIDFWVYISDTTNGSFNIGLPNSGNIYYRGLSIGGSTGSSKASVSVNISDSTTSNWQNIGSVEDNTWNHFAIEKENGALKYYINGYLKYKLVNNRSEGSDIVIPNVVDTTIYVDEIRVSRVARYKLQNLDDRFYPFDAPYNDNEESGESGLDPQQGEYRINVVVENSLTSSDENTPLAAAQGRLLNLNKREIVKVGEVDLTQTAVDLPVASNTSYRFGRLTRLNITSVPETDYESTIYFQAGAENCLSIPSGSKVVGSISTEEDKYYAVSILNGIVIMGEYIEVN